MPAAAAPAPEVAPAEVEVPAGFRGSVLEVVHPVSSLGMAPEDGETASTVEKTLFVPAGAHTIEVRIVAETAGLDLTGSIDGEFTVGEGRRLQVDLDPATLDLELAWAE